jgi:2-(3-amino-3-carboxypropyl)histidine synthase
MNLETEFDLDLESIFRAIRENDHKRILLQFPDGLRRIATKVATAIEDGTGIDVLIWAGSCFGACDIPNIEEGSEIDLIVQFGHARMPNISSPIQMMFIEAHSNLDVIPAVTSSLGALSKKVGIITTVQHIHKLNEIAILLQANGFEVHIGEAHGRIEHNGQVLGCNLSAAMDIAWEVDCFLFVGGGNFHPMGVAMATDKPVIVADPGLNEVRNVKDIKNRFLRQRFGAITKAKEARSFGILVSTKPGQMRMKPALKLRRLAEEHNMVAHILILNDINPDQLMGLDFEAYVSCACPRIAIDDLSRYKVPVLTPFEFEVVLDEKKWENYTFDALS